MEDLAAYFTLGKANSCIDEWEKVGGETEKDK
jgi:hypothetical protein